MIHPALQKFVAGFTNVAIQIKQSVSGLEESFWLAAFAPYADAQTAFAGANTLMSMTKTHEDPMHQAIKRTLAHRLGDGRVVNVFAAAVVELWHQIAERLEPVIGTRGFNVLFARAMHIASKTFPWLALTEVCESIAASLLCLKERLDAQEAVVACEASYALLVKFTDLLASLIGASLADRLLRAVWLPLPESSEMETKS